MGLSISTHRSHNVVHLIAVGEIDLGTVEALHAEIEAALEVASVSGVVVDLGGVTFLDSTGISALLWGRRQAEERGKGFHVDSAHDIVREVLDVTGVWAHLATGRP